MGRGGEVESLAGHDRNAKGLHEERVRKVGRSRRGHGKNSWGYDKKTRQR